MNPIASQLRKHFQSKRGSLAKALRRQSMQKHGMNCCQKCLYKFQEDQSLENPLYKCELHHLKQLKHFSLYGSNLSELKAMLNQPSNLIMLCHLCHREFHDLYEDKLDPAQDLAKFHEFMANPSSGDYLKGYLERQRQKKIKRQQEAKKHRLANLKKAQAKAREKALARG